MSLSNSEKEDLLKIIEVLFGHDSAVQCQHAFFGCRTDRWCWPFCKGVAATDSFKIEE